MIHMLIAGFGGQGVLFLGKIIATVGLLEDKQVSWLPSYGPEMRGGTANCSICIQDDPIGSPVVTKPKTLIALNKPSFDKFIKSAKQNANVIIDNSLIELVDDGTTREDISIICIPATKLANDHKLDGLANMILLGYLLKVEKFTSLEMLKNAVSKCIPKAKHHLLTPNMRALQLGYEYS